MIIKTIKKRILVPMWYKLRLLQMLARFGEDRFYNVEIEISSQCNFKCSYCPVSKFPRPNGILPTETYKNVIDQLREIGYSGSIAPHLYNEPLLDSRLPDLMGYTRSQLPKCKILLYTNGSLLNKKLFNRLISAGVDKIIISQHTPNMLPNIKHLFSELSPKEKNKIKYTNMTSMNYKVSNRGGLIKNENLHDKFYDRFYACFSPTGGLIINYKGFVLICSDDYNCTQPFGNVKNEGTMAIWNKPEFRKARKDIRNGKFNFRICQLCSKAKNIVDKETNR